MNYKPRLIARVPTQSPSDLEDPVILTGMYSCTSSDERCMMHQYYSTACHCAIYCIILEELEKGESIKCACHICHERDRIIVSDQKVDHSFCAVTTSSLCNESPVRV